MSYTQQRLGSTDRYVATLVEVQVQVEAEAEVEGESSEGDAVSGRYNILYRIGLHAFSCPH